MQKEPFEFLKAIEETPSPSGFEQPVQQIIAKRMKRHADVVETDVHGNLIVGLNPAGSPRVMLAGHADQIGLMVKYIDDHGFLFCVSIGGIDNSVMPGSRVTVHARGGPIDGIIGRKPVHLMKQEERGQKSELRDMWVDVGLPKDTVKKRISVGDPVTFRLGMDRLGNDWITSPGLDNKVGAFVVMEALRLASAKPIKCALYAVATVQEEIGVRGAITAGYGLNPQAGIAVDVTHATDYPDLDKRTAGDIKMGAGPVITIGANINPRVADLMISTAKSKRIPIQMEGEPGATGTDARAMQITRAGVATGLLSIPNRYMHTQVEACSLADLENAAKLLAAVIARIDAKTDFVPK